MLFWLCEIKDYCCSIWEGALKAVTDGWLLFTACWNVMLDGESNGIFIGEEVLMGETTFVLDEAFWDTCGLIVNIDEFGW